MFGDTRLPARFWNKIRVENGCWIWTGSQAGGGRLGRYGRIWWEGKNRYTHRVSYSVLIGPIPPGLDLDHKECDRRLCANPLHVAPATRRDNLLRSPLTVASKARARRIAEN